MGKIAFFCTSVFQIIHTRFIVEELKKICEVVYVNFAPELVGNKYEEIKTYLNEKKETCYTVFDFYNNQKDFSAVIVLHFIPGIQFLDNHIKKIRIQYGYAKDSWNYAKWNSVFDLILTYGLYAEERLSTFAYTKSVGHPRIRDQYQEIQTDMNGKKIKDSGIPKLLYCPTWSDKTTSNEVLEQLIKLTNDYQVYVKVHHKDSIQINNIENLYIFNDHTDLFDLLSCCDVVLSDYSGAIFDAMLFKKPIILFDWLEDTILDTGKHIVSSNMNIMEENEKIDNFMSLDIAVRNVLDHTKNTNEISMYITKALNEPNINYEFLLDRLYSSQDSFSAKRAANEIINILTQSNTKPSNIYKQIDINSIISFMNLNKENKIAIWGAGELGQILYAWLKSKDYEIDAFIDISLEKNGKNINNIPIIQPNYKHKIIIAVANHYKSISQELINKGYKINKDFLYPF